MTYSVKTLMILLGVQVLWLLFFFMETNDFIIAGTTTNWFFKK